MTAAKTPVEKRAEEPSDDGRDHCVDCFCRALEASFVRGEPEDFVIENPNQQAEKARGRCE